LCILKWQEPRPEFDIAIISIILLSADEDCVAADGESRVVVKEDKSFASMSAVV
jgi:hypothetical protein